MDSERYAEMEADLPAEEQEAFEAWVNNECDYQPWEGDAGHSHCDCGATLGGDGRIIGQCWACFDAPQGCEK